jgi:hypothetical protein
LAGATILAFSIFLHRNERRLEEEAEQALPGPLGIQPPVLKR